MSRVVSLAAMLRSSLASGNTEELLTLAAPALLAVVLLVVCRLLCCRSARGSGFARVTAHETDAGSEDEDDDESDEDSEIQGLANRALRKKTQTTAVSARRLDARELQMLDAYGGRPSAGKGPPPRHQAMRFYRRPGC